MGRQIDYKSVIEGLEAERKTLGSRLRAIESAIAALRPLVGMSESEPVNNTTATVTIGSPVIAPNAFKNVGVVDAAMRYLIMVGAPQSVRAISTALEKGGFVHHSKNLSQTVYQLLRRRAKAHGDIVNIDGAWGLEVWNGKKSN